MAYRISDSPSRGSTSFRVTSDSMTSSRSAASSSRSMTSSGVRNFNTSNYQAGRTDFSSSSAPKSYSKYGNNPRPQCSIKPRTKNPSTLNERTFVTQMVNNHPVVVFSKSKCPHCTDTKKMLTNKGVNYKIVELDMMKQGPSVQNVLQEMTNARTVPRIFIDGTCVGGNSDLKTLNASGELENLLKHLA